MTFNEMLEKVSEKVTNEVATLNKDFEGAFGDLEPEDIESFKEEVQNIVSAEMQNLLNDIFYEN